MPDIDIFDYTMADIFISETRPLPYRIGFRPRRHPRRPSLAYVNKLSDRDFAAYVRNNCCLPGADQDIEQALDEVQHELQKLRAELRTVRHKASPGGYATQAGGLDVTPRT